MRGHPAKANADRFPIFVMKMPPRARDRAAVLRRIFPSPLQCRGARLDQGTTHKDYRAMRHPLRKLAAFTWTADRIRRGWVGTPTEIGEYFNGFIQKPLASSRNASPKINSRYAETLRMPSDQCVCLQHRCAAFTPAERVEAGRPSAWRGRGRDP